MNNFLNKLEKKLGRQAIPNLTIYLIAGYVIGYVIKLVSPSVLSLMTLEPYYIIHGFQFWRLITWVMIPPSTSAIWMIIMMFLYYQLGNVLERTWGTFRYNLYIFGGIFFTIVGAFALYGFYALQGVQITTGYAVTTYYINMGIFLAFATCFPDMVVMLYFIIPVKMKYMAIFYVLIIGYDAINSGWAARVVIVMSLLNFIIFFFSTRNFRRISPEQMRRRRNFRRQTESMSSGSGTFNFDGRNMRAQRTISKHKCAICGRTELDDPTLEFRFCSKCEGNYEYCQDHLFTHQHIKHN